jgi:hypothetical protein
MTTNPKYKTWSCGTCNQKLGILHKNGVLSIKHKEFYCQVVGECTVICRYCGSHNTIHTSSMDIESIADEAC